MTRRKRYSAEFKCEALKRANEEDVTDVLVAEELGINARQLRRWCKYRPRPRNPAMWRDPRRKLPGHPLRATAVQRGNPEPGLLLVLQAGH